MVDSNADVFSEISTLGDVPSFRYFITPGKPTENPYIESFNDKFRNECLNDNSFFMLEHARGIIEAWRILFNTKRRHSSLGRLTPEAFCRME